MTTKPSIESSFISSLESDPLKTTTEFYASRLNDSPKAVAFLKDEFDINVEQATKLQVGFSDRRLAKTLPSTDTRTGRDLRSRLKEVGVYKANGQEALRGCVTFPLFDEAGTITGIFGRRIDRHSKGDKEITIGEGERARLQDVEHDATASCRDDGPSAQRKPKAKQTPAPEPVTSKTPAPPKEDDSLIVEDNQVTFTCEDRRYRIRGLEKNTNVCMLKVNLMASRKDLVHLDTLDLVKARSRASFIKATAAELFVDGDVVKRDIGGLLFKLEALREQQIAEAKAPQVKVVELTEVERSEAMTLLQELNLLERIVADITACGMVGEATNKLVGYLAATSRKLKDPLAIVIQSSSSAGKTSLMDAILAMMPGEDQLCFSGMTGQSLFYLDSDQIRHKILAISEDEGMAEATYALKLLLSEGKLDYASVGRDSGGGMTTQHTHVEGPVQAMITSTAMDIDEELVNRCLVLTVDETENQTGNIHDKQRQAFTTEVADSSLRAARLRSLHQNAQRLLQPIEIFNPYATQLTFPSHKTRMRRDNVKYLTLINTIAFLHQHQRTVHTYERDGEAIEYINVERSDITMANRLAGEILGRSLDELAPQTRTLLGLLHEFVDVQSKTVGVSRLAFRFTRRDVREATSWSDTQMHRHLTRLVDMEYLIVHRGKHGRRFVYELQYQGEGGEGTPFLVGLADPAKLQEPPSTTTTLAE